MIVLRKPYIAQNTTTNGLSPTIVAGQVFGIKNGINTVYTTAYDYKPGHITFFYNGQALHSGDDFIESAPNEVTLKYIAPTSESTLRATYEIAGSINGTGILSGKQPVLFGVYSQFVSFGRVLNNNTYNVSVDLVSTDVDPSIYTYNIGDKTTTGFTVYFSGDIDSNNFSLEWTIIEN